MTPRTGAARRVYVGGYAPRGEAGILEYSFDAKSGALRAGRACAALDNPSFLLCHPKKNVLYAVEELAPEGRVVALSTGGGELKALASLPSGGADPCHLALSPDLRYLFVSNYSGGSLAAFALDEAGVPTGRADFVQHRLDAPRTDSDRQRAAHIHFSLCDGARVYVCDLGMDRVFVYGWDAGRGRLAGTVQEIEFPAGSGPRHLALRADGRFLYALCELNSTVHAFERRADGLWRRIQRIDAAPGFADHARFDYSVSAAIRLADRETLCVSSRGCDRVAVFHVAPDGTLQLTQQFSSGGATPRDIQIVDDFLLAANQGSGSVAVFRRGAGGEYRLQETVETIRHPTCICLG